MTSLDSLIQSALRDFDRLWKEADGKPTQLGLQVWIATQLREIASATAEAVSLEEKFVGYIESPPFGMLGVANNAYQQAVDDQATRTRKFLGEWSQCNDCFDGDHDRCSGCDCKHLPQSNESH